MQAVACVRVLRRFRVRFRLNKGAFSAAFRAVTGGFLRCCGGTEMAVRQRVNTRACVPA